MRVLLHFCCICVLLPSAAQQRKLFVAAGQSNAVGMGDSIASKQYASAKLFEFLFLADSLKALTDPVGNSDLHFEKAHTGSLWPAFASEYSKRTGSNVIIVPAARGGSSCSYKAELSTYGTWDTTGNLRLFDSAIIKIKAAAMKTGLKVDGIIWSQGERDANAINAKQLTGDEYYATMKALIHRFRKALGEHAKFYIIQTGFYVNHPAAGFDTVRAVQQSIAREMKDVYIVYDQTGGFSAKGWMKDEIHYSQQALNNIGETIAEQIIKAEKK